MEDRPRGYEGENSEHERSPQPRRHHDRREHEERRSRDVSMEGVRGLVLHERGIQKPKIEFPYWSMSKGCEKVVCDDMTRKSTSTLLGNIVLEIGAAQRAGG